MSVLKLQTGISKKIGAGGLKCAHLALMSARIMSTLGRDFNIIIFLNALFYRVKIGRDFARRGLHGSSRTQDTTTHCGILFNTTEPQSNRIVPYDNTAKRHGTTTTRSLYWDHYYGMVHIQTEHAQWVL